MSAVITATCTCGSIGAQGVRLCPDHHRYFNGDKELVSVSRILADCWPIKPTWDKADPAVVANANDRGCVVDALFSAYVIGKLDRIPAGTRLDAVDLFYKLRKWWDSFPHNTVQSQVILHDAQVAGTCDVIADDVIYDIKTVYELQPSYYLQDGAYGSLYPRPVAGLRLIHVTARYDEPIIVPVPLQAMDHWRLLRDTWHMAQRYVS